MACIYPLELKDPDTGYWRQVRCGQCRACRRRRKQSWVGRLRLEAMRHSGSRFITLTYAQDPGILDYSDFQGFMKRYRERYGPCRFFACGEYGEKGGRGHWHALIFGHSQEVKGHWKCAAWGKGFAFDGSVTPASIGYVASYVMKGGNGDERRPLTRCSLRPGIGFPAIRAMAQQAARMGLQAWPRSYSIGGRWYPLCDGGLAAFQTEYSEAGGTPIKESSSLMAAFETRLAWLDQGTRASQKETSIILSNRDRDEQAQKA